MNNFDNDNNDSEAPPAAADLWTGSDGQHDPLSNSKINLDAEQASVVQGNFSTTVDDLATAAQYQGGYKAFERDHGRRRRQAKGFFKYNSESSSSVKLGWCDHAYWKQTVDDVDSNNSSDAEESIRFSSAASEEDFPTPDPSDPADGGLPCMARCRGSPNREAMDLG